MSEWRYRPVGWMNCDSGSELMINGQAVGCVYRHKGVGWFAVCFKGPYWRSTVTDTREAAGERLLERLELFD